MQDVILCSMENAQNAQHAFLAAFVLGLVLGVIGGTSFPRKEKGEAKAPPS